MITDRYWNNYIFCKHWSEVIVLALELLISTATKTANSPTIETNSDEKRNKRFKKYSPFSFRFLSS